MNRTAHMTRQHGQTLNGQKAVEVGDFGRLGFDAHRPVSQWPDNQDRQNRPENAPLHRSVQLPSQAAGLAP